MADGVSTTARSTPRWFTTGVEVVALVAALVPIVVGVVRAWSSGLVPINDDGWFLARSLDVFTDHHPLLGAWSAGSRTIDVWVNNMGPLYVELMAPFTKVFSYDGAALGVGVINMAAVLGVWFVARRLLGTPGVIVAMAATLLIAANMGPLGLIQARQQLALLLPFWCLLWLIAAMWRGHRWSLPWVVFVASVILQTHVTYAYQTAALLIAGAVGFVVANREQLRTPSMLRWSGAAAVVGILCWSQPLWDQFFGRGNLSTLLGESSGSDTSPGGRIAVRVIAEALTPPFPAPWSMAGFRNTGPLPGLAVAALVLFVWIAALVAIIVRWRRRDTPLIAFAGTGLVVVGGGVLAARSIPPNTSAGLAAQNYFWLWPVGMFLLAIVVLAVVDAATTSGMLRTARERLDSPRAAVGVRAALVLVLAVATVAASLAPPGWPRIRGEQTTSSRLARPLVEELGENLDRYDVSGPVMIDRSREQASNITYRYLILATLQRHGIEYRFPPGDTNIARFGMGRCEDGTSRHRLLLAEGAPDPDMSDDEVILAQVGPMLPHQQQSLERLEDEFRGHLRDGTIDLDIGAIASQDRQLHPVLAHFFDTGRVNPSTVTIAPRLRVWYMEGILDVPWELRDDFQRWLRLAAMHNRTYSVILAPFEAPEPRPCDDFGY